MAKVFGDHGELLETLPIENGGTGAATAAKARENLGATSRKNVTVTKTSNTTTAPTLTTAFANVLWGPINISVSATRQASVALSTFNITGYVLLAVTSVYSGRTAHSIEGFYTDESNLNITYETNSAALSTMISVNCLYVKADIINQ